MSDVPAWLKELSTDEKAQLKDWLETELQSMSRRDMLKAMGAVGAGGAMGAAGMGAMSQNARAADTGVAVNGEAGNPVDIYLDQILDTGGDVVADLDDTGDMDWQGRGFDNLGSIAIDELSNSIGQSNLLASWDGLLSPIAEGLGLSDAVDPANFTNPLAEAYSRVDTSSNGAGHVKLPPGQFTVDSETGIKARIGIEGVGMRSSIINALHDGFVLSDSANNPYATHLRDFLISHSGPDTITDAALNLQNFHAGVIESVWIRNCGSEVISIGGNFYENHIRDLHLGGNDAGDNQALIDITSAGPSNRWDLIECSPTDSRTGQNSDVMYVSSGQHSIGTLNIGGTAGYGVWCDNGASVSVDQCNYEPSSHPGGEPNWIFLASGEDKLEVRDVRLQTESVRSIYWLNGPDNAWMAKPEIGPNGTVSDSIVFVNQDLPTGATVTYEGPSADVDNRTGSLLTEPIHCLGDGVYKVSTGVGYDSGTDDTKYGP